MKKYFLLTSILALAACGGGSGGGGGAGGARAVIVPALPAGLPDAISQENATSNEYVTKMKSEVVVAAKGGHSYLARSSAPIVGDDGFTFTSYRLDDVKFFAADAKTTQDGYLNLGINEDGKIDRMYMVVGGVGANANAGIARDGDASSNFEAPVFEFVRDRYAEINDTPYAVSTTENTTMGFLNAISGAMNFVGSGVGSGWKQVGDVWKFDLDGENHFATWNPGSGEVDYEVNNAIGAMKNAVKNTNHFGNGKWVTDNGYYKYQEYGDNAVFRTVGTNTTDMDALNEMSATLGLGHWNRTQEILPVVTYGDDIDGHGAKLQYSDFGRFNPVYRTKHIDLDSGSEATSWSSPQLKTNNQAQVDAELAKEDYQLFAGGYAIKDDTMNDSRPSLDPIMGATYKGMAIGRVYTDMDFEDGIADHSTYLAQYGITGEGHDISKMFTTRDATMRITQSGGQVVQTLNMPFNTHAVGDKYYDIEIQQIGNTIDHVSFTGNESEIASQYRLYDAEAHWDTPNASFNPGYYGVDTATEAAGTAAIRAKYEAVNDVVTREYEVQAAWGMIKQ